MARQRRSLDEHLADMATRGRNERSTTFSTPAMAPLGPSLIADDAILTEHLARGAVTLEALDDVLKETLDTLAENDRTLEGAADRLTQAETRLGDLFEEVAVVPAQIETARSSAVSTAATDAQTKANKALADAKVDAEAKATAAKNAAITAAAADAKAQAEAAESRAATTAANDAKVKADAAQAAALAAAKTYADAQASGAGGTALEAAKADATTKANAAKVAAIEAAAAETKAKTEAAEARAATDAQTKANKALTDAKADATTKADAAKTAAVAAASTDATTKANAAQAAAITAADTAAKATAKSAAEAAEARVALAAAADAQTKATAAQNAALAAAKTYADTQASGASAGALEAAKQDATTKANTAKQAAIDAAALDATAKMEQAEADAAADAKSKADEALRLAKVDAAAKADAAKIAAEATAAADATTKMNNVANSKNATYYGTAAPTATAPKGSLAGDTYRRRNSAGNIIGEWEWVITNNVGAWVQRKMTSESMTAVDVGVLTAGSAVIQDAVAQKIAAGTAAIQKADIGNLTVTGTTNLADAVAQRIAANTARFISVTTDQLTAGTATIDQGVINKLYADVVQSRELNGAIIKAGSIRANSLQISGSNFVPDPDMLDPEVNAARLLNGSVPAGTLTFKKDDASTRNILSCTDHSTTYRQFRISGKDDEARFPVTLGDVIRLSYRYRVLGTRNASTTNTEVGYSVIHDGPTKVLLRHMWVGSGTPVTVSNEWQVLEVDYKVVDADVSYIRPMVQFRNPAFSGDIEFKMPHITIKSSLSVSSIGNNGASILEAKLGLVGDSEFPGLEFSSKTPGGTLAVGAKAPSVLSRVGYGLELTGGKPGGNSQRPPGESKVLIEKGNVYLTHENAGQGRGTHSDGHYTTRLGDGRRRIPLGLIHYWTNTTEIHLVKDTQLWQGTVLLPAHSFIKVTVNLRGYPNVDLQWLDLRGFANGQAFGRFVHYSPTGWNSNDTTMVFMYRHSNTAESNVTFRITGTNVVPTDRLTSFITPAPGAGGPPSTEILVEDIGSLNSNTDPLFLNS